MADDPLCVGNRQRLHSKLGNLPPMAFAQKSAIKQPLA
jgi:transposase InsO family protein